MDYSAARARLQAILAERPRRETLVASMPLSDPGDQAVACHEQEVAVTTVNLQTLRRTHAMIAIRRMDDGSYEVCLGCGGEISEARLNAVPETLFCCDCQKKLEKQKG